MNLFNNIKGVPEKELIDKSYKKKLAGCNAKLKSARAELKKQSDSLKSLQDEVVGAIQGTSKFDAGLLNDLIKQTRERVDASVKEVQGHEAELENQQQRIDAIQTNYKNLVGWSEIFQDSNMETKKMITAYLIDSVKVNRNYAVEVKFNLAYEQFCAVN
jgi:phage shock protein A